MLNELNQSNGYAVKGFRRLICRSMDTTSDTVIVQQQLAMIDGPQRVLRLCWASAAIVLVAGCATPNPEPTVGLTTSQGVGVKVKYRAPDFIRADLIDGKLAIAGVSGLGRDELDCAADISELLTKYLNETMPTLSVVSLADVRSGIGSESHRAMIASVGETLGPVHADFARLTPISDRARFWLWIHLNGADVDRSEGQGIAETTETVTDSDGSSHTETSFAGYNSTRSIWQRVRALVFVYDSATDAPVWITEGKYFGGGERNTFSPNAYQPYPAWPGGTTVVEPLARIAHKSVTKIPVKARR